MDNPQHYQPLSHALHPPQAQAQSTYTTSIMYNPKSVPTASTLREEEEEEEEEDGDEGLVEEQLNRQEPDAQGSDPASPQPKSTGTADARTSGPQRQSDSQEPDRKRRPGRPRGSKNRKPRVGPTPSKPEAAFHHPAVGVTPPQHPDVNAHNQQYYEFQWRVLNLCAEFYGAAEELVKGTPPLVIAQCYQMGPGNKVDPLVMLGDAKRVCDTLLANPSQLISNPPPPIYSVTPTLYQPVQTQPATTASAPTRPTAPPNKTATPTTVISNPQSFVVSLGPPQTGYPHAQYSMYAPPPSQYPTTSYYQYSTYAPPTTTYYPQPAPQPHSQPVTQPQTQPAARPLPPQSTAPEASTSSTAATTTIPIASSSMTGAGSNQGAWSEEETDRLKKLAEESRSIGSSGEMEWDWVVHQWGNGRTRHQILIKATSLGLKESSTRGIKRRRETEGGGAGDIASPSVPPTPLIAPNAHTTNTHALSATHSASPAHSQTASTPAASPALQNQQRPPLKPPGVTSTSSLPWPMPTVAVNTPSPVVTTATTIGQEQQRASYYRARPTQADASVVSVKPPSAAQHANPHQYMYQPNGSTGPSRLTKENGK